MIKAWMKLGIEGIYFNIVKTICNKPIANITLNGEKLKLFALMSVKRHGCSSSPLFFFHNVPPVQLLYANKIFFISTLIQLLFKFLARATRQKE
jgi:hypothetical protein